MAKPEFDLAVIGGGSGGLVVAAGGAALGAKVALVEKHKLGGKVRKLFALPVRISIFDEYVSSFDVAKLAQTCSHRLGTFGIAGAVTRREIADPGGFLALLRLGYSPSHQ